MNRARRPGLAYEWHWQLAAGLVAWVVVMLRLYGKFPHWSLTDGPPIQ